jgi:hypothetical protein
MALKAKDRAMRKCSLRGRDIAAFFKNILLNSCYQRFPRFIAAFRCSSI